MLIIAPESIGQPGLYYKVTQKTYNQVSYYLTPPPTHRNKKMLSIKHYTIVPKGDGLGNDMIKTVSAMSKSGNLSYLQWILYQSSSDTEKCTYLISTFFPGNVFVWYRLLLNLRK